jgi:hypothetical protein
LNDRDLNAMLCDAYTELFKRIQPADYLSRFLQEGFRPDGRRAQEFRKPALNAGMIDIHLPVPTASLGLT